MKKVIVLLVFMLLGTSLMAQYEHRGLDVKVELGYDLATKSGADGDVAATMTIGKRFNKYFFAGVGSGAIMYGLPEYYFDDGPSPETLVPIFADFRGYFPLENTKIAPFIGLKGGYMINAGTAGPDGTMFQFTPGVQIPLSGVVDLNISAGYEHHIPTKEEYDSYGTVVIKVGFGFHKKSK